MSFEYYVENFFEMVGNVGGWGWKMGSFVAAAPVRMAVREVIWGAATEMILQHKP